MRVNVRGAEILGDFRRGIDQRDAMGDAAGGADPVAGRLVRPHDQQLVMSRQLRQRVQQGRQPFAQGIAGHQQATHGAGVPAQAGAGDVAATRVLGRRQLDAGRDDVHRQLLAIAAVQLIHDQAGHGHHAPRGRAADAQLFQQQIGSQARTQPRPHPRKRPDARDAVVAHGRHVHDLDLSGPAVHVRMHDVELAPRKPVGPPCEVQHAHPAGQPAGKAHGQESERQVAVEVARDDGDIVALAQDAHQLHAIGLRASEAIAEAVDQQRDAEPPLSGAGGCLHTGSGTSGGSG
ncbi:hypothetical protein D3C71_1406200 [compost metagenome]